MRVRHPVLRVQSKHEDVAGTRVARNDLRNLRPRRTVLCCSAALCVAADCTVHPLEPMCNVAILVTRQWRDAERPKRNACALRYTRYVGISRHRAKGIRSEPPRPRASTVLAYSCATVSPQPLRSAAFAWERRESSDRMWVGAYAIGDVLICWREELRPFEFGHHLPHGCRERRHGTLFITVRAKCAGRNGSMSEAARSIATDMATT